MKSKLKLKGSRSRRIPSSVLVEFFVITIICITLFVSVLVVGRGALATLKKCLFLRRQYGGAQFVGMQPCCQRDELGWAIFGGRASRPARFCLLKFHFETSLVKVIFSSLAPSVQLPPPSQIVPHDTPPLRRHALLDGATELVAILWIHVLVSAAII